MKRLPVILLIAVALVWVACVRTDGFSPGLIEGPLLPEQLALVPSDAEQALAQPYHYFGKGRQCFVFESEDEKYVLKFFNQKYLQVPWYAFLRSKEKAKRAMRRHFYENSYEIAFRELGEGILYLHLGFADRTLPNVVVIDKASRGHLLDLNQLPFVLQKKGIPFYEGLQTIYEKEGMEGLHREIDAFVGAIALRIAKNIADADQDVEHNWGYIDGEIFHLDPGRLYYDEKLHEPERLQKEWRCATYKFHKWLKRTYPDAAAYLEAQVAKGREFI